MPPLAVAFVCAILPDEVLADYPAASAPGNRFQHGVLNAMKAHGIDTAVISLRPVSSYPLSRRLFFRGKKGTLAGVPYHQIGFINAGPLKTLTAAFTTFLSIYCWARQHRGTPRVMFFYNAYNPSAWVGIVAAWLTRSRMISIVADVRVPGFGGDASFLRRIEYHIAVASLKHMHAIVPVTARIATDLAPRVPFLLLNGGVPDDLLVHKPMSNKGNEIANEEGSPAGNRFVVLYTGSLTHLAGIPLLLQAFQLLGDAHFRLWITGLGELEVLVRDAAAKDGRIQYFGKLSRDKLLATFAAADVLVNPHSTVLLTAHYVFPSKLLEYLASGRPVITTATAAIAADYGELCAAVVADDPLAFANAIRRIAATPATERLARAATARAEIIERCAWSRQGERLVRFLEEQSTATTNHGKR